MANLGPLYPVNGPAPEAPPSTLIATARIVDEPDERWANGLKVRPWPCTTPAAWDPNLGASPTTKASDPPAAASVNVSTFTVVLGFACTVRGSTWDDISQRVRQHFAALEHLVVEAEFATDALSLGNPNLADASNLATAQTARAGVAKLENAAKGRGVIHTTPAVASTMAAHRLVEHDRAGRLVTIANQTLVVAGQGYPKATLPATSERAVITGQVEIRRSPIRLLPGDVSQAVLRSTNDLTVYAERDYAITFDPCTFAAVTIDHAAA